MRSRQVTALGLSCPLEFFGTPGEVISGGQVGGNFFLPTTCWLESDGDVFCDESHPGAAEVEQYFTGKIALALAFHSSTDSLCVVVDDGSMWCIGSNQQGKLGTGSTQTLAAETQVLPPGTFNLFCD